MIHEPPYQSFPGDRIGRLTRTFGSTAYVCGAKFRVLEQVIAGIRLGTVYISSNADSISFFHSHPDQLDQAGLDVWYQSRATQNRMSDISAAGVALTESGIGSGDPRDVPNPLPARGFKAADRPARLIRKANDGSASGLFHAR